MKPEQDVRWRRDWLHHRTLWQVCNSTLLLCTVRDWLVMCSHNVGQRSWGKVVKFNPLIIVY